MNKANPNAIGHRFIYFIHPNEDFVSPMKKKELDLMNEALESVLAKCGFVY